LKSSESSNPNKRLTLNKNYSHKCSNTENNIYYSKSWSS